MLLEKASPRNVVTLLAGFAGMVFDRIAGPDLDTEPTDHVDDLTKINGIGRTFARRLQEVGVYSYAKLATLTPEYVKEVTKVQDWQGDPAEWIAEAKKMTG